MAYQRIHVDRAGSIDSLRYIVGYPNPSVVDVDSRFAQLRYLGVEYIVFEGSSSIGGLKVLGKGYRSVVILVEAGGRLAAAKIRRADSTRDSLTYEARMLKLANTISVGPILYGFTEDIILMEYIHGSNILEWISQEDDVSRIHGMIRSLLEQAYRLDRIGLDHGELSRAERHILIRSNDEPVVIDFESASVNRKPRNLTSIVQYVAFRIPHITGRRIIEVDRGTLIDDLGRYKHSIGDESFYRILEDLNLTR
ncbi:MAG: serine/threonine protein kinase [Candidatus Bathyarchaeia archaeon]